MLDILKIGKRSIFSFSAMILLMAIFSSCSEKIEDSDSIEYIPVQLEKDGDWSLMSKDGKIKYENEFKESPSNVVNGLFSVKEGEGYSVYRADGEKPELVKGLENLSQVGELHDGLMPVSFPDKRIIVVDKDGNEKFELKPIKGIDITKCNGFFREGMLWTMNEDSKVGYFNTSGECAIAHKYDDGYSFSEGKAVVCKDSLWSAIGKDGKKLFLFKKGQKPAITPAWYKNNKMFMTDADGRFYVYDEKGESIKLSTKIKEVSDFNEKYIIYKAEGDEYGMMDYNGEVIIRPKYKDLSFGENDKLLASRKEDKWEILDYSGKKIIELDYSSVFYIKDFGYIGREKSVDVLINDKGEPISKDGEVYRVLRFANRGHLFYLPAAKIISQVVDMFNDNGIGDYKFGESMVALAQKQGLELSKVIEDKINELTLGNSNLMDVGSIKVTAWSQYLIAFKLSSYNYYSGYHSIPTWNSESKINLFKLGIFSDTSWGKSGVQGLAEAFKKKGFEVSKTESNKDREATILKKNDLILYILNLDSKDMQIFYSKGNIQALVEFVDEEFEKIKSNKDASSTNDEIATDTVEVEVVEDSITG